MASTPATMALRDSGQRRASSENVVGSKSVHVGGSISESAGKDVAVTAGNAEALTRFFGTFEEFFEAEQDRLLRALCVITASRAEAEDKA